MRGVTLFAFLVCFAANGLQAGAPALPSEPDSLRIEETQLTLRLDRARGQATVIGVAGRRLTVLTAAHFLSGDDAHHDVTIQRGGTTLAARIVSVARNPSFEMGRGKASSEAAAQSLGVDTAIARIEAAPRSDDERQLLETIRAADLTTSPFPGGTSQVVPVHIVDQFGDEHVVRAGNHLNPKCLAWGRASYVPQRGDSGAGVFIVRKTSDGALRPLLIGSVSQTDDRGGIASLACRSTAWIESALKTAPREIAKP